MIPSRVWLMVQAISSFSVKNTFRWGDLVFVRIFLKKTLTATHFQAIAVFSQMEIGQVPVLRGVSTVGVTINKRFPIRKIIVPVLKVPSTTIHLAVIIPAFVCSFLVMVLFDRCPQRHRTKYCERTVTSTTGQRLHCHKFIEKGRSKCQATLVSLKTRNRLPLKLPIRQTPHGKDGSAAESTFCYWGLDYSFS